MMNEAWLIIFKNLLPQLIMHIIDTVYTTSYILYTFWLCNVYLRFMAVGSNLLAKQSYVVIVQ